MTAQEMKSVNKKLLEKFEKGKNKGKIKEDSDKNDDLRSRKEVSKQYTQVRNYF